MSLFDDIYDPLETLGPFGSDSLIEDILPESQGAELVEPELSSDVGFWATFLENFVEETLEGSLSAYDAFGTRGMHRGWDEMTTNPTGIYGPNPANFDTIDWKSNEFFAVGLGRNTFLHDPRVTASRNDPNKLNDSFFKRYFYTVSDTYTAAVPELNFNNETDARAVGFDSYQDRLAAYQALQDDLSYNELSWFGEEVHAQMHEDELYDTETDVLGLYSIEEAMTKAHEGHFYTATTDEYDVSVFDLNLPVKTNELYQSRTKTEQKDN